jgi:hypothetical protein
MHNAQRAEEQFRFQRNPNTKLRVVLDFLTGTSAGWWPSHAASATLIPSFHLQRLGSDPTQRARSVTVFKITASLMAGKHVPLLLNAFRS